MFDLIIKNAKLVSDKEVFAGSIGIDNEKIAEILPSNTTENAKKIIDANGYYLFPGIIDSHAHLNDPGYTWREDFSHATEAAAVGGVTTVVDMPLQNSPALTDEKIFKDKERILKEKALIDYAFWGGLVNYNLSDLKALNDCGVMAFKSFLSPVDKDYTSLDLGRVREALKIIKSFDGFAGFHCEDYSIISYEQEKMIKSGRTTRADYLASRPVIAELIATQNIIDIAKEIGTKVHICHVTHPAVAEKIKIAKSQGVRITAETCPHYLIFSEDDFLEKGVFYKCAPPLRSKEARDKLWNYVLDGTLDLIVSDHSPAAEYEKSEEEGLFKPWGGISGLQTGLQVMFNEIVTKRNLSPTLISRTMAKNTAQIFGLTGKKGEIKAGVDADIVLVNPKQDWEITKDSLKYLNKISAFVGLKGTGLPVCTVLRGKIIAENGLITGEHGYGNLIKRRK